MLVPNLHFAGQGAQAIELYRRALGAQVLYLGLCDDVEGYGGAYRGMIYHAELSIGGSRLVLSDAPEQAPGSATSIMYCMDTVEGAQAAYEALCEDGETISPPLETPYALFFASLIDPFGIRWELIVERLLS